MMSKEIFPKYELQHYLFFLFLCYVIEKTVNATRKTKSTKAIIICLLAVSLHFPTDIVQNKKENREQEAASYSDWLFAFVMCFLSSEL